MAHITYSEKPMNSCMQRAKEQLEKSRMMYGPSNRELLKEITELKQMVADLKILVLAKPH